MFNKVCSILPSKSSFAPGDLIVATVALAAVLLTVATVVDDDSSTFFLDSLEEGMKHGQSMNDDYDDDSGYKLYRRGLY